VGSNVAVVKVFLPKAHAFSGQCLAQLMVEGWAEGDEVELVYMETVVSGNMQYAIADIRDKPRPLIGNEGI